MGAMSCRGAALLWLFVVSAAAAQPYPTKPVRVIVTFPPGAGVDIATRFVTTKLGEQFGRQFVIDNRAGAAGNIGVELAAHAAPDGYTLLSMTAAAAISQSAYRKAPFELAKDFAPVALIASAPFILAVHPSIPAKSLSELIALAKAKPGQLSYATPGTGSSPHLAGELLKMEVGIDILHVPYKGTVPAIADAVGGNVSMALANTLTLLPNIKAGRLRAIAITSAKRSAIAPDVPTIAEAGVPGFQSATWYAIAAPSGTPKDIVGRLNDAIVRIVQLPEVRDRLEALGADPLTGTPEQSAAFMRSEIVRWAKAVKAAGVHFE